jgi:hypothetical protein
MQVTTKRVVSREPSEFKRNVLWGVRHGLVFAGVLSLLVVTLHLFAPGIQVQGRELSVFEIIFAYLLGGASAGAVLGITRNWYDSAFHSLIGGAVVGAIGFVMAMLPLVGLSPGLGVVAIPGVVIGAAGGALLSKGSR